MRFVSRPDGCGAVVPSVVAGGKLPPLSPVVLTVLITCLAFSTPREIAVSRLLPAAPALAAAMWPILPTILLGTFCLLVMIGLSFVYTDLGTQYTAAAIVAVTLAAAYASHVRLQREEVLFHIRLVAESAARRYCCALCHAAWTTSRSSRCIWRLGDRPGRG